LQAPQATAVTKKARKSELAVVHRDSRAKISPTVICRSRNRFQSETPVSASIAAAAPRYRWSGPPSVSSNPYGPDSDTGATPRAH